jgi:hypothetical protein
MCFFDFCFAPPQITNEYTYRDEFDAIDQQLNIIRNNTNQKLREIKLREINTKKKETRIARNKNK